MKIVANSSNYHEADITIEPYVEPSQGGGEQGGNDTPTVSPAGVYLMGINGDWTNGLPGSAAVDNQSTIVVENWSTDWSFKLKVNDKWYGYGNGQQSVIHNGIWFDYPMTGSIEGDNFTLDATAAGKTVTFKVATNNAHFMASWSKVDTPSETGTYPGGVPHQGVVFNNDGTATFCLAAPTVSKVVLQGSWDGYANPITMKVQDYNNVNYFWATVSGINKTDWYTYFYTVDDTYNVADPYSPVVLDADYDKDINSGAWNNGADIPAYPQYAANRKAFPDSEISMRVRDGSNNSQKVRVSAIKGDLHSSYTWRNATFTPVGRGNMNIYELHIGDFNGTNGQNNGEGSFAKAKAKLDYLQNLGINMIELMPVMEFDMNHNWGYDTNSHFAVDKQYGTPTDLKDFIDECHGRGIGVILDIVFNHVTDLHPWKQMYAPGTSPFFNATAPHNYSVHNDFNQNYSFIEPYYKEVLSYWLTNYHVDGFRFDLVKGLGNNEDYNGNYDGVNRIPSVVTRMTALHAHMKTINPNVIHINEAFLNYSDEVALNADGQLVWLHQCSEAQKYVAGDHSIKGYGNLDHVTAEANGRGTFGTINYAESHDEPWLGYVAKTSGNTNVSGSLQSRMNRLASYAAQLLVAHGPKMLWQFCELGYDVQALPGSGYPRIGPKEVHWEFFSVPERKGLYDIYAKLFALRNSNPDMFTADVKPSFLNFGSNENARAIRIDGADGKEIILFVNPSTHQSASFTVGNGYNRENTNTSIYTENYQVIAATEGYTPTVTSNYGNVTVTDIPANGFCVLASKNVAFNLPDLSNINIPAEVTGVTISATESAIDLDEATTTTLTANIVPANAEGTISWTSSNTDVVTVADGVVTAVAPGVATITATSGSFSASCEVTVSSTFTVNFNNAFNNWATVKVRFTDGTNQTGMIDMTAPTGDSTIWTGSVKLTWTPTNVSFFNADGEDFINNSTYGGDTKLRLDVNNDNYIDVQDARDLLKHIHNGIRLDQ